MRKNHHHLHRAYVILQGAAGATLKGQLLEDEDD